MCIDHVDQFWPEWDLVHCDARDFLRTISVESAVKRRAVLIAQIKLAEHDFNDRRINPILWDKTGTAGQISDGRTPRLVPIMMGFVENLKDDVEAEMQHVFNEWFAQTGLAARRKAGEVVLSAPTLGFRYGQGMQLFE